MKTPYYDALHMRNEERYLVDGGLDWARVVAMAQLNPHRWFLVSIRRNNHNGVKPREGFVFFTTRTGRRAGVGYYRTYMKAEGTEPSQLAFETQHLPPPQPYDFDVSDLWRMLELPAVDMTDDGFHWTIEELTDAVATARDCLFEGIPIPA